MRSYINIALLSGLLALATNSSIKAQTDIFSDDSVKISFFSSAPLEDISAKNNMAKAILDASSGEIAVLVRIERFEFRKRLMQKHFNEQYMESDKYPEATFNGRIVDFNVEDLNNEAIDYQVKGTLSLHGIEKEFSGTAQISGNENQVNGKTEFYVMLDDYDIKRPRMLIKNIAERIRVNIDMNLQKRDEQN